MPQTVPSTNCLLLTSPSHLSQPTLFLSESPAESGAYPRSPPHLTPIPYPFMSPVRQLAMAHAAAIDPTLSSQRRPDPKHQASQVSSGGKKVAGEICCRAYSWHAAASSARLAHSGRNTTPTMTPCSRQNGWASGEKSGINHPCGSCG